LAGEWLHPRGVAVLKRLGLESVLPPTRHPEGRGFVTFPDDGTAPIALDYPDGARALCFQHGALVAALRESAAFHPNVHFVRTARLTGIAGQQLTFTDGSGGTHTSLAGQIVGADGRASKVRKQLGIPDDQTYLSHSAGVLLRGVTLPFEGYGHVFLGGPGPALALRVGADHVRVYLDLPRQEIRAPRGPANLWEAFHAVLPRSLRPAFREALETRPIQWAANYFRPRTAYGRPGVALAGDAVGHFHPLTAIGMTIGLVDAEALARSRSFGAYRRERVAQTRAPELLAIALYDVLSGRDEGTRVMRDAVYRTWRRDPDYRALTMRLLAADETNPFHFGRAFLRVVAAASGPFARDIVTQRRWRHGGRVLGSVGGQLHRLTGRGLYSLSVPYPLGVPRR
jgi:2-polyprenyl-6-methoxyphenol hydroxylase-like FAD-dependent oxidoreductase